MATRGRKSTAALTVLPTAVIPTRPEVPSHLSKTEGEEWVTIVDRMPAGFFTVEMFPMLAALCQHIVAARRISVMIEASGETLASDPDAVAQLDKLLKMRERENRAIASFSTKLRLTPQSRYQPSTAAAKTSGSTGAAKPWEFGKAV